MRKSAEKAKQENAGLETDGQKVQGWKMQDRKMMDKIQDRTTKHLRLGLVRGIAAC